MEDQSLKDKVNEKKTSEESQNQEEDTTDKESLHSEDSCCADCDCCMDSELERLTTTLINLQKENEALKTESQERINSFLERKTKEFNELVDKKIKEIQEKHDAEYQQRLDYAYESQLSELSKIISQFESVMNSITDPSVENYLVGFRMFLSQFEDLLDSFGIKIIVPQVGDEFDSETMEVSATVPVIDEKVNNKITKLFTKGYILKGRVIKLASVEVGKLN